MNNKIKLAVAAAVLASASVANAGIISQLASGLLTLTVTLTLTQLWLTMKIQ